MQTIESKLHRIPAVVKALGSDAARHLIHATGGSPRRARRAYKLGLQDGLIAAYDAALNDGMAHVQAVAACDRLWKETVAAPADAEPADEDEAEEV